ncbi:MAG: hypothetical protein ACK6D3_00875 [Planctomycetaceae bacterium]
MEQVMDWRRLREPALIAAGQTLVLIPLLLAMRPQQLDPGVQSAMEGRLDELQLTIKGSSERLAILESRLERIMQALELPQQDSDTEIETEIELHRSDDAVELFAELGESPSAVTLAESLAVVDLWVSQPDDADQLQQIKSAQVFRLRQTVKKEVDSLHEQALAADSGKTAQELHAEASRILALYPIDSSQFVLDEARSLASRHSGIGVRLDVIRRQRYNAWAVTQIEETIDQVNSIASSFKTSDNPLVIEATVKGLGEVDPLLLEPVISQLYNYAVEQAKSNINSSQQLELARKMIDPSIQRKGFGDF